MSSGFYIGASQAALDLLGSPAVEVNLEDHRIVRRARARAGRHVTVDWGKMPEGRVVGYVRSFEDISEPMLVVALAEEPGPNRAVAGLESNGERLARTPWGWRNYAFRDYELTDRWSPAETMVRLNPGSRAAMKDYPDHRFLMAGVVDFGGTDFVHLVPFVDQAALPRSLRDAFGAIDVNARTYIPGDFPTASFPWGFLGPPEELKVLPNPPRWEAPHRCPACGDRALVLFNVTCECVNVDCRFFRRNWW